MRRLGRLVLIVAIAATKGIEEFLAKVRPHLFGEWLVSITPLRAVPHFRAGAKTKLTAEPRRFLVLAGRALEPLGQKVLEVIGLARVADDIGASTAILSPRVAPAGRFADRAAITQHCPDAVPVIRRVALPAPVHERRAVLLVVCLHGVVGVVGQQFDLGDVVVPEPFRRLEPAPRACPHAMILDGADVGVLQPVGPLAVHLDIDCRAPHRNGILGLLGLLGLLGQHLPDPLEALLVQVHGAVTNFPVEPNRPAERVFAVCPKLLF